jgi:hypothetical protein
MIIESLCVVTTSLGMGTRLSMHVYGVAAPRRLHHGCNNLVQRYMSVFAGVDFLD